MATRTSSAILQSSSSLANFVAWARLISDALTAFGWTQTADTGQVNWGTLGATPANPATVYEVYKAADALAATCPIFLRFDYGVTATTVTGLVCKVTFGTGSDGAGTITGNVGTQMTVFSNVSNTGGTFDWNFSGDSGGFRMISFRTGVNVNCSLLCVERSRDAGGNKTASYFTVVASTSSLHAQQSIFAPGSSVNITPQAVITVGAYDQASGAIGTNAFTSPVFPMVGYMDNPMISTLYLRGNDVIEGTTFPCTLYGTSHTYLPSKTGSAFTAFSSASSGAAAIRWE